jgi:hypothetical protein
MSNAALSSVAVSGGRAPLRARLGTEPQPAVTRVDLRRALHLVLAAVWLLDGVLQYQSWMYTKAFAPQLLAMMADGNPAVIARPITWDAALVGHHLTLLNTVFATIQLLLGLGIAFRPTVRAALAASVAWSVGVWWFGEGLGGVLTGGANPLSGAPGAVIIYALIAVLLWPADRTGTTVSPTTAPTKTVSPKTRAPFTAARAIGAPAARFLWLVFWLSQCYFMLTPANRAPQATSAMIAGMADGEPGWLAALLRDAASLTAQQGLATSVAFGAAFAVIAVGVYLPAPALRAVLVLTLVVAAVIWVFAQALGAIIASGSTDPNSAPLLALLALAYWPHRTAAAVPAPAAEGDLAS